MQHALIIEIVPMGNLANRLIQYLAALELQRRVPGAVLSNVVLPELGIAVERIEFDAAADDSLTLRDHEFLDVDRVVLLQQRKAIRHVRLWNYCQRIANLPPREVCREAIAAVSERAGQVDVFGDDTIVINIRADEILTGVLHYPLLPIAFYRDLIARSGKRAVFIGQLDDSDYCRALRAAFPDATYRPSQGALKDFETMRRCSHLVLSVSTFTWLAGWLSSAEIVEMPMVGLFNRTFQPDTDLLPLDDPRFRFWSFPTYFGLPSPEFLQFQHRLEGTWRLDGAAQVAEAQARWEAVQVDRLQAMRYLDPFMATIFFRHDRVERPHGGPFNAMFDRIADRTHRFMDLDEYFYCHEYPDAGRMIMDGVYKDAFHHYISIGDAQGCRPRQKSLPVVSRGRPALLSSIASAAEGTATEQATRAIDDPPATGFAFRTMLEDNPWWMIDLGCMHEITDMYIHNRDDTPGHARAATPLDIEFSEDGTNWTLAHRCGPERPFGDPARTEMLRWFPRPSMSSRFVRIIVRRRTTLHLRSIAIHGQPLS